MSNAKKPKPGELVIDASDIKVIDITPDQVLKLTKVRDGFEKAVENLTHLKPEDIERAGINPKEIKRAADLLEEDQRIGELLPAAEKLAELLRETRLDRRHQIATILAEVASQARRRADRVQNGAEVLGPLAELVDYQYGPAAKATATKGKAKSAKEAAGAGGSAPA